jgi:catechol 2,3-dioxygenase-like lactoylglutathione lyase family enzyme
VVPVSDVDLAKAFYRDQLGFNADHDHVVSDELRFVQLTPPARAARSPLARDSPIRPPGRSKASNWSSTTSRSLTISYATAASL